MKSFTITSTLEKSLQNITVNVKESAVTRLHLYINRQWIATLYKNEQQQYKLLSYSSQPFTFEEIRSIGKQIDREFIPCINTTVILPSKAA